MAKDSADKFYESAKYFAKGARNFAQKGTEKIETAPWKVLERLSGGTGSIFDIIKRIFVWIFGISLVFLFAAFVVLLLRCGSTGACETTFAFIWNGFIESPAGETIRLFSGTALDVIWNPDEYIKPGGAFSFEEEQTEVEEFGLRINRFRSDRGYEAGEPINAIADVNIKAPEDYDMIVDFSKACKLEDYNGRIEVTGPFTTEKKIIVKSGGTEDFQIGCEFLDGVRDLEKEITGKILTFSPSYEMKQDVRWFAFSKSTRSNNDKKIGVTKAISKGPMIFSLYSLDSQPFYVGTVYRIYVELDNNELIWEGNLEKISSIQLNVPDNVKLQFEDQFCNFASAGGTRYTVKPEAIARANVDCNALDYLLSHRIDREECLDNFKDNVAYSCKFEFTSSEEVAAQYPFSAEIVYSYTAEETAVVTISKAP